MAEILTLLDFAGYVALLLWGVHMVQTGIQRAFGAALGRVLNHTLGTRLRAFGAGLGITAILQSSTATSLMISGFAASGAVALVPALAAILGANVGTTLIVQVLAFDLTALAPVLILFGVWMFRRYPPGRTRDLGRVMIGLGLLLFSLHALVDLFLPLQQAPVLRILLQALSTQPVATLLIAAILTWAAHSSVAIVILIMSMATHHLVTPTTAYAMVMGANLGTAINPLLEGVTGDDPAVRRLPLGNLLTRVIGVFIGLMLLPWLSTWMAWFSSDSAHAVANFHTLFNAVIALLFLPFLTPYSALLSYWLPKRLSPDDPTRPQYLEETAHHLPAVALGHAAREALRLADMLCALLSFTRSGFKHHLRHRAKQARQLDLAVDKLETAITLYLATLDHEEMTQRDTQRMDAILAFTNNIGHATDTVYNGLLTQASRLHKQGWQLAPEQHTQLDAALKHLLDNTRRTAALFVNADLRQARTLANEKAYFRNLETQAADTHLNTIKAGHLEAAELGQFYLDILRDVKNVNAHLVSAAAYPILAQAGELLPSRLRDETPPLA